MRPTVPFPIRVLLASLALAPVCASAQTNDGYHSLHVFPVVVDTASFTQRFSLDNNNSQAINVEVKYFPAEGTTQATPLDCGSYPVTANRVRTFTSLRQLCPSLASGSQFGFLTLRETESRNAPFAAYSRVSNPQGQGFSVEAFPAHTFGWLPSNSIGVRRLAAGAGTPAFQTNCFLGGINHVNGAGSTIDSSITVFDSTGQVVGQTKLVSAPPGKITRILDVFAFVGAPAGDYDNATVQFYHESTDPAGRIAFCTVQDNTSFGADFRIAKQIPFRGYSDSFYMRDARMSQGVTTSTNTGYFRMNAGGSKHNTHVMYFRHPDFVQCELVDRSTGVRALPSLGLEMRLLAADNATVIAGGNDQTGFGKIYLGDKPDRNGGANTRYAIQVETTSTDDRAGSIVYDLRCQSGSGHTQGELIEDNLDLDLF